MKPLQGYFLKTMDLDAVYGAIARCFPAHRQLIVGAAGGWVAVHPDGPSSGHAETAARLAELCAAPVIVVEVRAGEGVRLELHDVDGGKVGELRWDIRGDVSDLELLHVELRGWLPVLQPDVPDIETAVVDVAWSDEGACLRTLGQFLQVPNIAWNFERVLAEGGVDAVEGWRTFRARIDGAWMQLAARRWLDPAPGDLARNVLRTEDYNETGDFDVDDLNGPFAWLELDERQATPGQTVPITVHVVAGDAPIGVVDIVVRVSGAVAEAGEPRQYESSMEIARSLRIDEDDALIVPTMVDIPRLALVGTAWRIQASAVLLSGDHVTTTETIEVIPSRSAGMPFERPGRWHAVVDEVSGTSVGNIEHLEALPPLIFADGQVVFARGLYHVTLGAPDGMQDGALIGSHEAAETGRYAKYWVRDDDAVVMFTVRPGALVDVARIDTLLNGVPAREFVLDARDPELNLTALERWDQLQRRSLVAFARALQAECVGGEGLLAEALASHVVNGLRREPAADTPSSTLGILALFDHVVSQSDDPDEPRELFIDGMDLSVGGSSVGGQRRATGERAVRAVDVDAAFFARLEASLEREQAERVIAQVDAAIEAGLVDARLYGLRSKALEQLAGEMKRYGTRVGFADWAYEEPYQARVTALHERLQRTLRAALWMGHSPDTAARLAATVGHPLEALQAWERALSLAPDRLDFRYAWLSAAMCCDGSRALEAAARVDALAPPAPTQPAHVQEAWVRALQQAACVYLAAALQGGEPSYLHHGLAGEPTPVTARDDAQEWVGRALSGVTRLEDEAWPDHARTAALRAQLRAFAEHIRRASSGWVVDLASALRLAELARAHEHTRLGRFARAVGLSGYAQERDPSRLIARAKVCSLVYAHEAAKLLLDRARILSSHGLLPVLDAEASLLRAQGQPMRAMGLADQAARIAPEQTERANTVFERWVQHGLLHRAEDLFRYFLIEVRGSATVGAMLARWALRISENYVALEDSVRALRPIEWLLFVGHEIDPETLRTLRGQREQLAASLPHRGWYEPVPDDEDPAS